MSGNLLIIQSGVASVVGNASIYGALAEALNYESIEEIYGVYGGFEGLQNGQFVDLAALSQQTAKLLLQTAGFSLRSESSAFDFGHCNLEQMLKNIQTHEIRYVVCIGDTKSILGVQYLLEVAQSAAYDLHILSIPHSNTNELPLADHSLGYGSYLKYLNAGSSEFAAQLQNSRVRLGIYEVSGGDHGWVAAGAALNFMGAQWKQSANIETPFLLCLPEQPLNENLLVELIQEKMNICGYVCLIVNHQLVNEQGDFLNTESFGESSAHYLNACIQERLGLSAQVNLCELSLQPLSHFISKQDQLEAIACGKAAVQQLVQEESNGKAAILLRKDSDRYDFDINFVDLSQLVAGPKFFPTDWTTENFSVQYPFVKYATPLIQGEVEAAYERGLVRLVKL